MIYNRDRRNFSISEPEDLLLHNDTITLNLSIQSDNIPILDGANATIKNNIGTNQPDNLNSSINAQFEDPQGGNFQLRGNSPAIDIGENVNITNDILGNQRPTGNKPDMGAFEYVGNNPPDNTPPMTPQNLIIQLE